PLALGCLAGPTELRDSVYPLPWQLSCVELVCPLWPPPPRRSPASIAFRHLSVTRRRRRAHQPPTDRRQNPGMDSMSGVFGRRTGVAAVAVVLALLGSAGAAAAEDVNGSISGVFSDSHGNPMSGVNVIVYTSNDETFVGIATTDDSGHYTVPDIAPGDYIVEFDGPITQYAHGQLQPFMANTFTVAAGADTTVDETALPLGTLAGTLTNPDGSPAAGVSVSAFSPNSGASGFAITDDSGQWTMSVLGGDAFEVNFNLPNGLIQYAPGQADQQNAAIYPVASDQTTTVDDQLLATGTIVGQYTDAAGNPDANTQVVAFLADGAFANFAFTDAAGTY